MAGHERSGMKRWAMMWWGARTSIAIGWTIAVLVMLWSPPPPPPDITIPYYDLYVHFALFFGVGASWRSAGVGVVRMLGFGTLLGIVSELVQGVLPWPRTPDALDVAADVAGLVVAGVAMAVLARARDRVLPIEHRGPS